VSNRIRRQCYDCERKFSVPVGSKVYICPVCQVDLEEAGVKPNEKQPEDKGDYKPRFNGMRPFEAQ
jgi:ribosomal protein L37AE/L43A